jgi:hypothetical protein
MPSNYTVVHTKVSTIVCVGSTSPEAEARRAPVLAAGEAWADGFRAVSVARVPHPELAWSQGDLA